MKKVFKQSACKMIMVFVCALFMSMGIFAFKGLDVKAANASFEVDLSGGKTFFVSNETVQCVEQELPITDSSKKAGAAAYLAEVYLGDNDYDIGATVFSKDPFQGAAMVKSGSNGYSFIAAAGSVGTGKYTISKDTLKSYYKKEYNTTDKLSERSALGKMKKIEKIINGTEGNGTSVFTVIIKYTADPLTVDTASGSPKTSYTVGTTFEQSDHLYTINSAAGSVAFTGTRSTAKKITIPDAVVFMNHSLPVTEVSANALKGNKKVKTVNVGANVTAIRRKAFFKCPNLKTLNINSVSLTKIEKKALGRNSKQLTVKIPKQSKKAYKTLFKKASLKGFKINLLR
ncbi:MAG: hypothetical protein E7301_02405 [Butyrivibrio sp.]|nr:hypothetical protein [Butyrivibrio sp.]